MARVIQYPHFLFVETPVEAHQDENGNWVGGIASVRYIGKCRHEPDGRGTEIKTADGTYHHAASTVYCPKATEEIKVGSMCIVANDMECQDMRHVAKCLRFDASQLHCRLWL